jgi:hypothetical protein
MVTTSDFSLYWFNKEHNMGWVGIMLMCCIILGVLDGIAKLRGGTCETSDNPKVSMGHHYQRDVVFKDLMGM